MTFFMNTLTLIGIFNGVLWYIYDFKLSKQKFIQTLQIFSCIFFPIWLILLCYIGMSGLELLLFIIIIVSSVFIASIHVIAITANKLTNTLTPNMLKSTGVIYLVIFILFFVILSLIGTILIYLFIITPFLFLFTIYKWSVKHTKTNIVSFNKNTLYGIITLIAFSILFLLVSLIYMYSEELLTIYFSLLSIDGNFGYHTYLLDDDGLRHPLEDRYNVLTRRDAGEKITLEADCYSLKHGHLGTLGQIGKYEGGIYHREFRHVLPHVERWLHTRGYPLGSDISQIVCSQKLGWAIERTP